MTDDIPLGHLTTEARNPQSVDLDRMTAADFVALCVREDHLAVDAVGREGPQIAAAIDAITARLERGGRLIYLGAGTSGRLGVVDASECPPTFQAPPELVVGLIAGGEPAFTQAVEGAEDDREQGAADLRALGLRDTDCVVGITASGRTPYVLGGLEQARAVGALSIGLSCNAGSEVAEASEIPITPVVGPEVLSGSTRLKAGTATKLVLNMLSTGVMVRLGKTFGNLMVDLQASNKKLVSRSRRIVAEATGCDPDTARQALDAADGVVKVAIVSVLHGLDPEAARQLLERHGGRVRSAVEERP